MRKLIFLRRGDFQKEQQMAPANPNELTPAQRLISLLQTIQEPVIYFSEPLKAQAEKGNAAMYIFQLTKARTTYVAQLELFGRKEFTHITDLPKAAIEVIEKKIRKTYHNKLHNYSSL